MLSRILHLHSRTHLRLLSLTLSPACSSSSPSPPSSQIPRPHFLPRHHFSTNNNNNGPKPTSDFWKLAQDTDNLDDIFGTNDGKLAEGVPATQRSPWAFGDSEGGEGDGRLFDEFGKVGSDGGARQDGFLKGVGGSAEEGAGVETGFQPWKFEEDKVDDVFGIGVGETGDNLGGDNVGGGDEVSKEEREMIRVAQKLQLEEEEQVLLSVIKGPDRAFGDLVAASGISDAMLDSLIALKNFKDIEGLPPLKQLEDERYEKTSRKSARYEIELQKQEEAAKARVRKVDEKGRAYGTGKRKCSIARVWVQPGEGIFLVNDKEFDVYFPALDHCAALLRPFSETRTLGLWDIKCTVKGGGVSGQVDAVQLGISRALQNWEPGLRLPLRAGGFLTRDPRVVERKKPGKAKARKSFQWVKR